MKKALYLVTSSLIVLVGLVGIFYWYWLSQPEVMTPLQTVALDNPDITSFDDVCTPKDEYELDCKGNIQQFECDRYRSASTMFADLQPSYPMLICEKKYDLSEIGLYRIEKQVPLGPKAYKYVDYIVIKDNTFQRIQTEGQFRQLFQPITSVEEAIVYFEALHKAFIILRDEQLSGFEYLKEKGDTVGTFYVSSDSIGLSEVTETWNGYSIKAYSYLGEWDCVTEVFQYKYLLKKNGRLVEKDKQLIWESKHKQRCIN